MLFAHWQLCHGNYFDSIDWELMLRAVRRQHREPCESRGSRTDLGAPGCEIPPGDSTLADMPLVPANVASGVKQTSRDDDVMFAYEMLQPTEPC